MRTQASEQRRACCRRTARRNRACRQHRQRLDRIGRAAALTRRSRPDRERSAHATAKATPDRRGAGIRREQPERRGRDQQPQRSEHHLQATGQHRPRSTAASSTMPKNTFTPSIHAPARSTRPGPDADDQQRHAQPSPIANSAAPPSIARVRDEGEHREQRCRHHADNQCGQRAHRRDRDEMTAWRASMPRPRRSASVRAARSLPEISETANAVNSTPNAPSTHGFCSHAPRLWPPAPRRCRRACSDDDRRHDRNHRIRTRQEAQHDARDEIQCDDREEAMPFEQRLREIGARDLVEPAARGNRIAG